MAIFNSQVKLNNISELFAMQDDIILAVTALDFKLHLIVDSHVCGEDRVEFLQNKMPFHKCIIVSQKTRDEAQNFCKIIKNVTGRELFMWCPLCGHPNEMNM